MTIQLALDQSGSLTNNSNQSVKKLSVDDLRDAELPFVYDDSGTLVHVDVPQPPATTPGWAVQWQGPMGGGGVDRFFLNRVYLGKHVQLTVIARRLEIKDLLCSKVVLRPEKLPSGQFQPNPPVLPVRSQSIALFATCTPAIAGPVGNLAALTAIPYRIRLADGRTYTHSFPVDQSAAPDVAIWPDFQSPAWRCYQVLFAARGASQVIDLAWRARFLWRNGGAQPRESLPGSLVTEIDAVPDWVEVMAPNGDPRGVFELNHAALGNVAPPSASLDIALDFGTANTCVSYPNPSPAPGQPLTVTAPFKRDWVPLLPGADASTDPRWTRLVGASEIPSELVVLDSTNEATIKASLSDAGRRFIPHPDQGNDQDIRNERVLSGFKWADARRMPSTISALNLPGFVAESASAYLRDILLRACAELVANANVLKLRVSYPQAFSSSAVTSYNTRLRQVTSDLANATGIALNIAGFANESLAAVHSAIGTNAVDYCLLIDVGGGTTDYAVTERLLPDAATGGYAPANPANVSSIRMAGFDLAEAIIEPLLPSASNQKDRTRKLLELTRRIRTWRTQATIQEYLGDRDLLANRGRIAASVNDGFLGLAYMGAVLLAARLSRDIRAGSLDARKGCDVTTVLSGNGWSLSAFGLASPNFAGWVANQVAAEQAYAERLFRLAWDPLEMAIGMAPGAVRFTFMRPLGKAGTSQGLFTTKVVDPTHAAQELPLEPMGIELMQSVSGASSKVDPTILIPYPVPAGGSVSFGGFWHMPSGLETRLAKAVDQGMTLVQHINRSHIKVINAAVMSTFSNHPTIQPGNYVWDTPLKVILEQMLPIAIRKA